MKTFCVVADPSPLVRAGMRSLLERDGRYEPLEAGDDGELWRALPDEAPGLAVVALELPPSGGIASLARLRARSDALRSLLWGAELSGQTVLEALSAGAAGCLEKTASSEEVLAALRTIESGGIALSETLVCRLAVTLHERSAVDSALDRLVLLSGRERRVLELLAQGLRNREIAELLDLSQFTVKRHVQNILAKLELPSRQAASRLYHRVAEARRA